MLTFQNPMLLFSCSVLSDSSWPHGLQPARLPCPSLSPEVCSHSCPSSLFSSVQSLSHVQLFATPMDCSMPGLPVHHQLPEFTQLMSIQSVMPSNHLILCHLLHPPLIFPSIRVFSKKSVLCIRWPNYWSFSFNISPSNEYLGLIPLGLTDLISLQSKELSRVFSNTTVQKHQFFGVQLSL